MPDTHVLVDGFGNLVNATTRKEFEIHNDGFDQDEIFHAANHKFIVSNVSLYQYRANHNVLNLAKIFNVNQKTLVEAAFVESDLIVTYFDDTHQIYDLLPFEFDDLGIQSRYSTDVSEHSLLTPCRDQKPKKSPSKNPTSNKQGPVRMSRSKSSGYGKLSFLQLHQRPQSKVVSKKSAVRTLPYQRFAWQHRPPGVNSIEQASSVSLVQYNSLTDFRIFDEKVFLDLGDDGLAVKPCTDEERAVFSSLVLSTKDDPDKATESAAVSLFNKNIVLRSRQKKVHAFDIKYSKSPEALVPKWTMQKHNYQLIEKLGSTSSEFAVASIDSPGLCLFNRNGKILHRFTERLAYQRIDALSNTATTTFFTSSDRKVNWLDWNRPETPAILSRISTENPVFHLSLQKFDDSGLLAAFSRNCVQMYDYRSGPALSIASGLGANLAKYQCFGDFCGHLIAFHADAAIRVFDVRNLKESAYGFKHLEPVTRLQFSPHSHHLYALSKPNFLKFTVY